MNALGHRLVHTWVSLGPRFLPFSDIASAELPLSRLLRLSLFQVSVGMALVLLVGTLNRVMIVELATPASLVGIMLSLPLLFAPFRAIIGFRSDNHVSALGWRRVPFIWRGTMLQFGGLAIMPFALLVLAGKGHAAAAPAWIGQIGAAIAFLLVGAGVHMVQTVGLALATDLVKPEDRPKMVGLMYVMLLVGMTVAAIIYGWALADFTHLRLVQVIQGSAIATVVLNVVAMWRQETRNRTQAAKLDDPNRRDPEFMAEWRRFIAGETVRRRLFAIGLGTMGFGMADVLLEPYGGQVLALAVADTTRLTALMAIGSITGFVAASRVIGRGGDPVTVAGLGAVIGILAFMAIIAAAPMASTPAYILGTLMVGIGAGLFGHGTLTATMQSAPDQQAGMALGAWGAVQATAAGLGLAFAGIIRDLVAGTALGGMFGAATGYLVVYAFEIMLLTATLVTIAPLIWPRANATPATR